MPHLLHLFTLSLVFLSTSTQCAMAQGDIYACTANSATPTCELLKPTTKNPSGHCDGDSFVCDATEHKCQDAAGCKATCAPVPESVYKVEHQCVNGACRCKVTHKCEENSCKSSCEALTAPGAPWKCKGNQCICSGSPGKLRSSELTITLLLLTGMAMIPTPAQGIFCALLLPAALFGFAISQLTWA